MNGSCVGVTNPANVHVDDPAQMQTAFAGEEYSKSEAEATSDIAARHDAVLAINGDYYNYKDKVGLVIRNAKISGWARERVPKELFSQHTVCASLKDEFSSRPS